MSNTTNNTFQQNIDELDRQIKQAEMIRQYLQVTNVDKNVLPMKNLTTETEFIPTPPPPPPISTPSILPLSSFNFNELRKDLKMAEERVERLREEIKELQKKREDSFIKTSPPPPPPYVPPTIKNSNSDYLKPNLSISTNRGILDTSTSPLIQELLQSQQQHNPRQMINNRISPSFILPNLNGINHFPSTSADASKEHRHRQAFLTMHQHREQLVVHLDSLKQALNSLDRLASLEPTQNEIQLANIKFDKIHQKSRQLQALKSNRSSQQSPFIECRIRQLEHDLVYMLSEHQKDVQAKLEINEQRSLMLLKIMQVTDEITTIDQQIQQLLSNTSTSSDIHRLNSSPSSAEINQQQQTSLRVINPTNNLDTRRVSFREPLDNNPLTKLPNIYYHHHHHHH